LGGPGGVRIVGDERDWGDPYKLLEEKKGGATKTQV